MVALNAIAPTVRIVPDHKETLRKATERKHRGLANMAEVMIRDYCRQCGVKIPTRHGTSAGGAPS